MDIKPKGLIKRVLDFAVGELERRSRPPARSASTQADAGPSGESASRAAAGAHTASRQADEGGQRPQAHGLHVAPVGRGALKVRWSLTPEELRRSSALAEEGAVLCLRLVTFAAGRDHVTREVQDRPSVGSHGECEVGRSEGRTLVALGLRSGTRFVSIAHHVV